MYEAVRAQRPIKLMRNAMKYAWTLAERSDKAHRYKQYRREIDARMGYFVRLLGELQQVPVEFQRLSVDDVELNNAYDMMSFSKRLKQVSLPTRPLVFSEGEVVQLRHTEINRAA